tara:strand:+ start:112 stop:372 length:261 start_codon:yes stop_codon:yes gene_type:complete
MGLSVIRFIFNLTKGTNMTTVTKRKSIEFSIGNLFWTPKSEEEYKSFIERYNGSDRALVALSSQISINYILNKINKEFDIYKKKNK